MQRVILLASTAIAAVAAMAHAQVTVPDDYATIQAAISSGAPVIHVRSGFYPEDLTIDHAVVVQARPPASGFEFEAHPVLAGNVTFLTPASSATPATLQGLHVEGAVIISSAAPDDMIIQLQQNRIDGGISQTTTVSNFLRIRGNTVFGDVSLNCYSVDFSHNSIVGGGLVLGYEGSADVRSNHVVDSPVAGIDVNANDGGATIARNSVDRASTGIVLRESAGGLVEANRVTNSAGNGYEAVTSGFGGVGTFAGNTALDSGSDGYRLAGTSYAVTNNRSERSSGDGFDIAAVSNFAENVSLGSGGDGAHVAIGPNVSGNVVGRSGVRGLVVDDAGNVVENTSYLNAQNGYVLNGSGSTVARNIAHGNGGFGLVWAGPAPTLDCNDWFGNTGGATSGTSPGATDFFVNPLFCDLPADDVSLSSASPLVGTACGQIGATGVGCPGATAVLPGPGEDSSLLVFPQPASGAVRFAGPALARAGVLRIFDSRGALCWKSPLDGTARELTWDLTSRGGHPAAPGVYFARLETEGRTIRQRVVIVE